MSKFLPGRRGEISPCLSVDERKRLREVGFGTSKQSRRVEEPDLELEAPGSPARFHEALSAPSSS